jgi:hypothetical protein
MDTNGKPHRVPRRTIILLLLTVALLNVPAIAVATHLFRDVSDGSTHAAGIHYIAGAGITAGCTPTTYCPNDTLTRAQMGSFLHRASGNAPGIAASTNAATVTTGGVFTVSSEKTVVNGSNVNRHSVACPAGTEVVGGGSVYLSSGDWVLEASYPENERTWVAEYRSSNSRTLEMAVYARCLAVGQ